MRIECRRFLLEVKWLLTEDDSQVYGLDCETEAWSKEGVARGFAKGGSFSIWLIYELEMCMSIGS